MQFFASQEELGELCRILDEDLESYAGFCFTGGAWGVVQDFSRGFGELCRFLLPGRSLGSYAGF